jgi:hypothetical protein
VQEREKKKKNMKDKEGGVVRRQDLLKRREVHDIVAKCSQLLVLLFYLPLTLFSHLSLVSKQDLISVIGVFQIEMPVVSIWRVDLCNLPSFIKSLDNLVRQRSLFDIF